MRRHWMIATGLAAALLAGMLTGPAGAADAGKPYTEETRTYIVKTKHGDIFVQVAHPVDGDKLVKGPAIFTYSPYSILGDRRNNDSADWVPQGYHRVWADVVGTGNSGGCWDYGGIREKETGYELVEWIAKQKWSTGKVGMIGGSYEGTTANAAAVMKPPHLTTIVPQAAISRWYGYAYSGGIRYFLNNETPTDEGVDTPAAFDFGLAVPPPLDPQDPNWAERFSSAVTPCDEIQHTEHGYDDTPDYDKFWLERDYLKDAHKIDIPVLVSHNYGDWNVKQEEGWNFFHALKNSPNATMFFGNRYETHGTPGHSAYNKTVHLWMDHYLMGKDNGADKLPRHFTHTADYNGPGKLLKANKFNTRNVTLIAQETPRTTPEDYAWKLLPTKPLVGMRPSTAAFPSASINTEFHSNHHSRVNHDWYWFESPALKEDTRIFGEIKVKVFLKTQREWVTMTPTIVDVDMECMIMQAGQHVGTQPECLPRALYSVTRGFLDSRYRNGLDKQVPLKPGKPFRATIVEKPTDYVFKKGHHIALNFSTEILEWALPKPYNCAGASNQADCVNVEVLWKEGKTRVVLPIVDAPKDVRDLFTFGHHH